VFDAETVIDRGANGTQQLTQLQPTFTFQRPLYAFTYDVRKHEG